MLQGLLGVSVCKQLDALGYEVHAVSSNSHSEKTINWHQADLLDSQQCKDLMGHIKPTHLLHLAWYAEPGKYWNSINNYHWVRASFKYN